MRSVNERTRLPLTWRSFAFNSVPLIPQALRYRIDCESTGTELVGWTDVSPDSVVAIIIAADVNRIINVANDAELKTITVQTDSETANEINADYTWRVKNMFGVT